MARIGQVGSKNPNWKGGRTVTEHGYVLIKAPGHARADVRGYVYEHILVAEKKLGRPLLPGEEIHHKDLNRSNNDPLNLEVHPSRAWHRVQHRRVGLDRRLPGEENPIIECACACGSKLELFDQYGRRRRFISGHNRLPEGMFTRG